MNDTDQPEETPSQPDTVRQAYNLVTDTVTGPNIRFKDNLYQGLIILACVVLGALIGFFTMKPGVMGALVGGFIGVLAGLFGSGIFLMIYRAVRHLRGKHE
ncbi:MAG TPA: hypothetical protein VG099_29925 [Gemmataceae bacterium]|jgi:Na+/H+ antiporter NhaD/arsenite permease-like protein|nr:hypothetical protein [Gemmataceae bacterium]